MEITHRTEFTNWACLEAAQLTNKLKLISSEVSYNLTAHEERVQCVDRPWIIVSCKLAAPISTCIYQMVSAMMSYSSLTSRRIFASR